MKKNIKNHQPVIFLENNSTPIMTTPWADLRFLIPGSATGDTLRRSLGLAQTGRRLSEEKVARFGGGVRLEV